MLFQLETSGADVDEVVTLYWRHFEGEPEGRGYADEAVRGVASRIPELDTRLGAASVNWRVERMSRVDRNVLRLGAWELLHRPDVPRAVILDEAVELAKAYGTDESGAFVNGVLDKIAELVGR